MNDFSQLSQAWVAFFGVPTVVTSDNGGSFTANFWKDMMSRLNIEVKYSALYHPQSVGLIERQHRSIKESLKASIEEMVGKHQQPPKIDILLSGLHMKHIVRKRKGIIRNW